MKICRINTDEKRDVNKFIRFPMQLYRGNPFYCPALESEARFPLQHSLHPFYRHSNADFFLAESEGQVLGRIAAVHNSRHNEHRHVRTAFFWAFDVVDDLSVANQLFEEVFAWAHARNLDSVLGPRGLTGSDAAGVLVEGFDQRAVMGVPYNHPYYDEFICKNGFNKLTDHFSGYASAGMELPSRLVEIAKKVEARRGYKVLDFNTKEEMIAWVPRVLAVHEQSFAGTHEFHPDTPEEMQLVVDGLLSVADPRLVKLLVRGEEVIGFGLCYPDLSDGLRKSRGRIFPFGWWHLQREFKKSKWLIANGVGVLPAYQNLGGNAVLYNNMWSAVQKLNRFEHVDIVQVNETNFKSKSDMENLGVKWTKKHRSYFRKL